MDGDGEGRRGERGNCGWYVKSIKEPSGSLQMT